MFRIDEDGNIGHVNAWTEDDAVFGSLAELELIADARRWSKADVTRVYDAATAEKHATVKNRPYGLRRIWEVIQRLAPGKEVSEAPERLLDQETGLPPLLVTEGRNDEDSHAAGQPGKGLLA